MVSSPPVIGETQPIMRMVEDLPAPLGPRNPKTSPRRSSKSTPSTAVKGVAAALGRWEDLAQAHRFDQRGVEEEEIRVGVGEVEMSTMPAT